ncbi:MAG: prepilin-type N-terminal cleavage/methylation domain-containing protein [Candidatus Pacebacteria bacterium]|nr:prepilin-type N-terminal cleavage/methylation domain-containing protein [Candidatus Paceibacterota bacterium]
MKKGFTLIELLMVVAIVSLISTIVMGSLNSAREKARIAGGKQFSNTLKYSLGSELVGEWTFNDSSISGTNISDVSGNVGDGDICGGAVTMEGVFGEAMKFDGINDYVSIPDDPLLHVQRFTIEAWVYNPDLSQNKWLLNKYQIGSIFHRSYSLMYWNNFGYSFYIGNTSHMHMLQSNFHGKVGWNHIAMEYDGDNMKLYVDGIFRKRQPTATPLTLAYDAGPLFFGTYDGNLNMIGVKRLDEVRIYNRPLSSAEIYQHYVEGLEKHNLAYSK